MSVSFAAKALGAIACHAGICRQLRGEVTNQLAVKGDTILSPTLNPFTSGPVCTMTPVNSWPMIKPVPEG